MKNRQTHKTIIILTLILLVGTSIASAFSINPHINQEQLNSKSKTTTIQIGHDPKIETIINMINETILKEFLETLVGYGPRRAGTYGCIKAARYVHEQFENMNLETRFHNWTSFGNRYNPRFFTSQNVEGIQQGTNSSSDRILLLNAHYDTSKNSPGANDDGSGTAAVMATAYVLSQFEFEHTIKFVTFSGEEIALIGSTAYAKETYRNQEDILVDLNADMIGHADTGEGGSQMTVTATDDVQWIQDIAEQISNNYDINLTINRGGIDREGRGYGDYWPFVLYGYEAIAFWGGEGDPNMHTWEDDLDNINFSYLVNTTRVIAGTLAYLADTNEMDPQILIESLRWEKLYFEKQEKRDLNKLRTIVIDDIWIWAETKTDGTPIEKVEFYYDDILEYTDTTPPFKWNCNKTSIRKHRITVIAYDQLGRTTSDWIEFFYFNLFKKR